MVMNNNGNMSQLIMEQHSDPEIGNLYQMAVVDSETSHNPICYYTWN